MSEYKSKIWIQKEDGTKFYFNPETLQYKRVHSLSSEQGNTRTWYYLDTVDGSYEVGPYIWDEINGFQMVSGGSGSANLFIGLVDHTTTSFPSIRPDGSALVLGDYVKPVPTETFPFSIEGKIFNSNKDTGVYMGTEWIINANPYQNTGETPVKDKTQESILGISNFQDAINKEIKETLTYVHVQGTASTMWSINHNLNRYPSVCCIDSTGNQMYGEVSYPNKNNILVEFSTPENGQALLS